MVKGLTILGGEPFQNVEGLGSMIEYENEEDFENKKKCYIYGDSNNINDIEYENYPKDRFHTIIHSEKKVESWPNVEFYYNSLEMTEESDYLGNIDSWPIFSKNVVKILKKEYPNLEFYPVKLIDVATGSINTNYFVLHVLCIIDAFDMKNSKYRYNEKIVIKSLT